MSERAIQIMVRGTCGHEWQVDTRRSRLIPAVGECPVENGAIQGDDRVRFRCPIDDQLVPVEQVLQERRCADGCGTVLNRYNRDQVCAPCRRGTADRNLAKLCRAGA